MHRLLAVDVIEGVQCLYLFCYMGAEAVSGGGANRVGAVDVEEGVHCLHQQRVDHVVAARVWGSGFRV